MSAHFRAHGRRVVHLGATLRGERERAAWERHGRIVDLHIAGAGVETEEPLLVGERLSVAFLTPTLWDPLILTAFVVWAQELRPIDELDALGRQRQSARSGLRFDYPTPDAVLAMFEMLQAIGYE